MKFELSLAELSAAVESYWPERHEEFPLSDPFVLTACLQKSLRRSNAPASHGAARALLRIDPQRLWKRMSIIAFEDFGLSDERLTRWVVAAASSHSWRKRMGGDQVVLSFLIDQFLCRPRDRRVDELYMWAVANHPGGDGIGNSTDAQLSGTLSQALKSAIDIVVRCERYVPYTGSRAVIPRSCDLTIRAACEDAEFEIEVSNFCTQARRTTQCLLPVIYPLARRATAAPGRPSSVVTNLVPEVRQLGLLPSYVLDGYTRTGLTALSTLAKNNPMLAELVAPLPSWAGRKKALTNLLFVAEGGICTTEVSDPFYEELKQHSVGSWTGLSKQVSQKPSSW